MQLVTLILAAGLVALSVAGLLWLLSSPTLMKH